MPPTFFSRTGENQNAASEQHGKDRSLAAFKKPINKIPDLKIDRARFLQHNRVPGQAEARDIHH
jgi:hypothetical protein